MPFYKDHVYPYLVSALGNPKPIEDIRRPFSEGIDAVREVFVNGTRGRQLFRDAVGDNPNRAELLEAFRFLAQDLDGALPVWAESR